jgi:hypothetical protein
MYMLSVSNGTTYLTIYIFTASDYFVLKECFSSFLFLFFFIGIGVRKEYLIDTNSSSWVGLQISVVYFPSIVWPGIHIRSSSCLLGVNDTKLHSPMWLEGQCFNYIRLYRYSETVHLAGIVI